MGQKGLSEPHIFLASGNHFKLVKNLSHILSDVELNKIIEEANRNAKELYDLGLSHFEFAKTIDKKFWRQKISRLYYAAYNLKRAMALVTDGSFSTDSSDHQKIDQLPQGFGGEDRVAISQCLKQLRDDRNLADYSHRANENDLIYTVIYYQGFVDEFFNLVTAYLISKGVIENGNS